MEARSTGSHCGGHALGWLASASLVATMGLVMCEMKAGQKAAATPMRTSAWKHGAYFFATSLVALAGAASSATSLIDAFSLVALSATATAFLALTSACSAAACLAAFLATTLAAILVATTAASAADFLVLFMSFGTGNVPNLLCRAKTW